MSELEKCALINDFLQENFILAESGNVKSRRILLSRKKTHKNISNFE